MNSKRNSNANRREFLQQSGVALAGTAVLSSAVPAVHAGENNTIRLALIGCGSRGAGAVANAFNTRDQGPIALYAMADLHEDILNGKLDQLTQQFGPQVDVAEERRFLGFDAYKKAIDTLRPGDVAMCTTRAYIRPLHVEYAVSKGINVFMEKPFASDPVGLHRMLQAAHAADSNGVKIAAGLQCRHSPARAALIERINQGELGELSYVRANRLAGRHWMPAMGAKSASFIEQLKQGRVGLLWVGSGHMVDYLIHQIDECCWLMNDWPISCHGMGGREVDSQDHGQNLDVYALEYTFANGKKAFCGFRRAKGGHQEFATFVHGSQRAAQFSGSVHKATVHIFKDHHISNDNIAWTPTSDERNPWDYEWIDFVDAIRNNKPYNEGKRAVYADYAALMGRAAAHTNQVITREDVTNSRFQFCDDLDNLSYDSPAPVCVDDNGFFPAPRAGEWQEL